MYNPLQLEFYLITDETLEHYFSQFLIICFLKIEFYMHYESISTQQLRAFNYTQYSVLVDAQVHRMLNFEFFGRNALGNNTNSYQILLSCEISTNGEVFETFSYYISGKNNIITKILKKLLNLSV